jgi:hypothetical protein
VQLKMMATFAALLLLPKLLPLASVPAVGYLGLTTDRFGVYHEAPSALDSLHSDYRFFRHHEMAAGRLVLDSVASFGDSAHIRLLPSLKAHSAGGNASITLDLCSGNTSVTFTLQTPPARACLAQKILNNSNTAGWTAQTAVKAANRSVATPQWCQKLCCASLTCSGFTYTDPQPGTGQPGQPPAEYMCWLQQGATRVVPGGPQCSGAGGHCWSAVANTAGDATWSVSVDGAPLSSPRPFSSSSAEELLGYSNIGSAVDVFIDGSNSQVFANGNVITSTGKNCSATGASLTLKGADAVIQLDAWKMVES